MGLDQNLYRTTKKRWEAMKDYERRAEGYRKAVDEASEKEGWWQFLRELPRGVAGSYDREAFTGEQKARLDDIWSRCAAFANEAGVCVDVSGIWPVFDPERYNLGEEDTVEELCYWRKNWPLHEFIVNNFLEPGAEDNCVDIPLDRDAVMKIIDAGLGNESFGKALYHLATGDVVYYHPWY